MFKNSYAFQWLVWVKLKSHRTFNMILSTISVFLNFRFVGVAARKPPLLWLPLFAVAICRFCVVQTLVGPTRASVGGRNLPRNVVIS
jgi:hypothetical protein